MAVSTSAHLIVRRSSGPGNPCIDLYLAFDATPVATITQPRSTIYFLRYLQPTTIERQAEILGKAPGAPPNIRLLGMPVPLLSTLAL
jgi:hypothetical protein